MVEATICIALVIWAVFLTDLIRRRMSRRLAMGGKNEGWVEPSPGGRRLPIREYRFRRNWPMAAFSFLVISSIEGGLIAHLAEEFSLARGEEVGELRLEILDLIDRDLVEELVLGRPRE